MNSRAVLAAFLIIFVRYSAGGEQAMRLTLDVEKKAYHFGDAIHFHLVYKNISQRQLLILTETEVHLVKIFSVKRVIDGRAAEDILGPSEVDIAWEGLAKKAVRLRPGAQTKREIEATIEKNLPRFYDDPREGLFLIMSGSAMRLPGHGTYEIRARFYSPADHPVNAYLHKARLWQGDVVSNAVRISIE